MDTFCSIVGRFFIFLLFFVCLSSCSLNYEDSRKSSNNSSPEFSFSSVFFNRYEENRITVSFTADKYEQYRSNTSYAKSANFEFWNNQNEKELVGFCKLIRMQHYKNVFTLYDDIDILNLQNESSIQASVLQWNSDKKTLISDKTKPVHISKKNLDIEGQCFSANGNTNKYEFLSGVTGSIETEDSK